MCLYLCTYIFFIGNAAEIFRHGYNQEFIEPTEVPLHISLHHMMPGGTATHTATHCYTWLVILFTLKRAATFCNTLQHAVTLCNTLQHTAMQRALAYQPSNDVWYYCLRCNALQHTATQCNRVQHTATHCNTLQRATTHCNALQHTAPHCNALQRNLPLHISLHQMTTGCTVNTAKHCQALATHCNALRHATHRNALQTTAVHCNTLQQCCNTLQQCALTYQSTSNNVWWYCSYCLVVLFKLLHPATQCKTLQRTAPTSTHCNALQRKVSLHSSFHQTIYICIYVYTYICIYVQIFIHTYTYT